jgi:hypothetical protein
MSLALRRLNHLPKDKRENIKHNNTAENRIAGAQLTDQEIVMANSQFDTIDDSPE